MLPWLSAKVMFSACSMSYEDRLQCTISSVKHLKLPFTDVHIAVVNTECDWSGAENWVQLWTTKRHLQMLAKPFSIMNSSDWDNAPRIILMV